MAWLPLNPVTSSASVLTAAAVTIGGIARSAHRQPTLLVTIRAHMLQPRPAWLKRMAGVAVMLGDGADAGKMLITAGGSILVNGTGGKKPDATTFALRMAWPDHLVPAKQPARPAEAEVQPDGSMLVKLPGWLTPPNTATVAAADAARAKAGIPPITPRYISVSEREPDPAALARGRRA